ncbi:MAG: hypothetical protein K9W45_05890 [Candidatus Heimdallarchaeum aukensis]|uniref:Uncharacterized protein n=1 Tax=Candidatus Heimdallarchaeum aukensis TaxID=2876573 RepID=A0A9Y1FM33_9ARCH|nr:MAG: hypothetical protein K9W45_05890 [Candidatus Heimdallarchaeum aukensis]
MNKQDTKTEHEEKEEKIFKCTGCHTPLSIYDERCPRCERKNPHYIYR